MKLAFIGGGNMAFALIVGLKNKNFSMSDIVVVEHDVSKWATLEQLGVQVSADLNTVSNCSAIVLAIKPQQLSALAKNLTPLLTNAAKQPLIISIAAGIRLTDLSRWLGDYQTIVRAMPNVSKKHIALADQILKAAGSTIWLDSEEKLDAVTAISGSGPAYVFYFIEALQAAALNLGLNEQQAKELSIATFKGASLLADASTTPIETLRMQVTSKGGTTEQGVLSLENLQVKQAIMLAAQKACERANTLGIELGKD